MSKPRTVRTAIALVLAAVVAFAAAGAPPADATTWRTRATGWADTTRTGLITVAPSPQVVMTAQDYDDYWRWTLRRRDPVGAGGQRIMTMDVYLDQVCSGPWRSHSRKWADVTLARSDVRIGYGRNFSGSNACLAKVRVTPSHSSGHAVGAVMVQLQSAP